MPIALRAAPDVGVARLEEENSVGMLYMTFELVVAVVTSLLHVVHEAAVGKDCPTGICPVAAGTLLNEGGRVGIVELASSPDGAVNASAKGVSSSLPSTHQVVYAEAAQTRLQ